QSERIDSFCQRDANCGELISNLDVFLAKSGRELRPRGPRELIEFGKEEAFLDFHVPEHQAPDTFEDSFGVGVLAVLKRDAQVSEHGRVLQVIFPQEVSDRLTLLRKTAPDLDL